MTAFGAEDGSGDEDEPLDVLDLPQLYTKPPADVLLSILADLNSAPPSWDTTAQPRGKTSLSLKKKRKINDHGVPQYLTRIIASPLTWIHDENLREQIWETSAQRLAERSGRTAMGDITRTFRIPIGAGDEVIDIELHEPALTADNLGLKTWASSFLLAKRLHLFRQDGLSHLTRCTILELGAGTGLVGIAAAAVFRTTVVLTDLPEIVPNLEKNAKAMAERIAHYDGRVLTGPLDWSNPGDFAVHTESVDFTGPFPLIVVADPIYSPDHPRLLVQAIQCHLVKNSAARVVIELPLREAYASERQDLRDRMQGIGLEIIEQGEESGFDDWSEGSHGDELAEVRCWWSVWAWKHNVVVMQSIA